MNRIDNRMGWGDADFLFTPRRAAELLQVSRSQIDVIAFRAGWSRVYLSTANHGNVWYRLRDILKYMENPTINNTAINTPGTDGTMGSSLSTDDIPF